MTFSNKAWVEAERYRFLEFVSSQSTMHRITKFDKNARLLVSDAVSALYTLEGKYKFDIVFMDPPYNKELEKGVLEYLSTSSLLKPDTMIIVEASVDTSFDYVEELGFEITKYKKYKTNVHVFLSIK